MDGIENSQTQPARRLQTSWRRAGTPGSFRSRPSTRTITTTSGLRSVRPVWQRGKSWNRHYERSEAIHLSAYIAKMDCFVAIAPLPKHFTLVAGNDGN